MGNQLIVQVLEAVAVPITALIGLIVRRRRGTEVVMETTGLISLAITVAVWAAGRWVEADRLPGIFGLVELAALLVLMVVALRSGQAWRGPAAALAAGMAVALWPSRFEGMGGPDDVLTLVGFGAVFAVPAAVAGRYLRGLDDSRRRSVAAAKRVQRIELAHDLHDFVAHDVSGMVAQAQAGMVLAATDPVRAAALFERIEAAGQQALASLDRTVHLLRTEEEGDGAGRGPQPGLAELYELAERFTGAGGTEVRLEVPPTGPEIPREVAATAYRIVVEALTNVRRHAPAARTVDVRVRRTGGQLEVAVTDDGTTPVPQGGRPRRGGSGLDGLTARVEALGGRLSAGREQDGGWRVAATMPLEGR
ncbi:sensor histidine kinase [Kitasatospora sp. NPDC004240]